MAEDLYLRPNSTISAGIEQQYPASGSHHEKIDEETADDNSTYLRQSGYDEEGYDYFGLPDPSAMGSINSVKLVVRGMGTGWSHCYGRIKTHNTLYGEVNCEGSSYETVEKTWSTNPNTGQAWTWQEINDLQIQIELNVWDGGCGEFQEVRCTQAYIVVNYNPLYPPTVTTAAVSDITYNSGKCNGEITATGGENATERGFEYKQGAAGTIIKTYDTGSFGTGTFNKVITGLSPNTLYYVRAYAKNVAGIGYGDWVTFTTAKTTPTVITNEATEVDKDKFKANGNITATGGENCTVRGFQYGLTPIATWDTHDEGSYEAGAFNKVITGLQANTIYYFRAYATNPIGTSYGNWLQVVTASAGTTPSGTKVSLVGDYSGYINQLHASEQDLGSPYKGYFVLTTDFAEGQSLAVYKRLLYLVNYFRKETSGEVKISVKCDNETNWREMGTVELTGDEDILMQEMGVDELAKSFLIKVESENAFRYLGTIFWYLVQGVR